ncbi:hypothetical protein QR680_007816 [Steinernema hermaphroditum]|uniref:Protein transport protein SEC23 n=1 Tax=Steinernema hermaphroditum TaxID=289476 RepID=A0AA39M5Y0_9BILA|nr:hypothetical protein QR680_007816 [Steinernema hermaphroditum]
MAVQTPCFNCTVLETGNFILGCCRAVYCAICIGYYLEDCEDDRSICLNNTVCKARAQEGLVFESEADVDALWAKRRAEEEAESELQALREAAILSLKKAAPPPPKILVSLPKKREEEQKSKKKGRCTTMAQSWDDYLAYQEKVDGIQFTWNILPHSRDDAIKIPVPIGVFYQPLKERPLDQPQQPVLNYEPVLCQKKTCKAVLNPLCFVDYQGKSWKCNICQQRNMFPPHYAVIAEDRRPPELYPQFATIEYTLRNPKADILAPIFVFVLDTCVPEDELKALKESIQTAVSLLPADSLVSLVTYGKMVELHELTARDMPISHVFNGAKEVRREQMENKLRESIGKPAGIGPQGPIAMLRASTMSNGASAGVKVSNKFLQPPDHWDFERGKRPLRCTGAAVTVAVALLEVSFPNTGARIMTFLGGACTYGPGAVIDNELKNPIRSWHSIREDDVPYMHKATKFYDALADRAAKNGHTIDVYSGALDQTGLYEMRSCFTKSGGHVVMTDSFKSSLFKQSYQRVFEKDSAVGAGLKIRGLLGCCANGGAKTSAVSDKELGIGGTCQWKFCSLTPRATVACLFEVTAQSGAPIAQGSQAVIQFVTQYQGSDGTRRMRVTTTSRPWADMATQKPSITMGFDQDAAAVLMARLASWRATNEAETPEAVRWLDRSLVKVISKFAEYHKGDPMSLRLSDKFNLFPQFMFHLRRSQFLRVFNSSPDETVFYRHVLNKECVMNSTTMIQPVLYSYSFQGEPEPALLDTSSIVPDKILLMDDFFHVLIYHGQTIDAWKKMKYHEDPKYISFKQLLEAPVQDSQNILAERFPVPRYIVTEYEGSQARFLLSKVNPSLTHNNPYYAEGGAPVFTDDVSLQVFMEHLKKLAVSADD